MKKLLTLLLLGIGLKASAQLNYCTSTIPSVSLSIHVNKEKPQLSNVVFASGREFPTIFLIKGSKQVLDKDLLLISRSDGKEDLYLSFGVGFDDVTIYDVNLKPVLTMQNDSKLKDRIIAKLNKKRLTINDFF